MNSPINPLYRAAAVLILLVIWTEMAIAQRSHHWGESDWFEPRSATSRTLADRWDLQFSPSQVQTFAETGCNVSTYQYVPGSHRLFISRMYHSAEGRALAGDNCSSDAAKSAIKANDWGLVLMRLENGRFSYHKSLLAPHKITSGPLRGAEIFAIHDANIVTHRGRYFVAFVAIVKNGAHYGINGSSSFLVEYDPSSETIIESTIHCIVSGAFEQNASPYAVWASVPELLSFNDELYVYWLALKSNIRVREPRGGGFFQGGGVRGAKLQTAADGLFWADVDRVDAGKIIEANDANVARDVWMPNPSDPYSDTLIDIRSLWVDIRGRIVMLAAVGGSGCTRPDDPQPGCYRMVMTVRRRPLERFDSWRSLGGVLPTNPQGYTRPIRNSVIGVISDNPDGYSFLGQFFRPAANGYSELRTIPPGFDPVRDNAGRWRHEGRIVAFPFEANDLWPRD